MNETPLYYHKRPSQQCYVLPKQCLTFIGSHNVTNHDFVQIVMTFMEPTKLH